MNWYELLFYKYIKGAQGQSKLRIMTPVFKGGTEQILPENGSTPTTAPIIADIRYPDALRTDQTFLYRESPTQESGNARLRRIKGNTLAFNQLIEGSFASTSGWTSVGGTLSASGNVGTFKCTVVGTQSYHTHISKGLAIPKGHKLLIMCDYMPKYTHDMYLFTINTSGNPLKTQTAIADKWNRIAQVFDGSTTDISSVQFAFNIQAQYGYAVGDEDKIKNCQVIDLTLMGLDISSPSEFTSLFPLPYYSYQSTLLPFKGTVIKTIGKNQIDATQAQNNAFTTMETSEGTVHGTYTGTGIYVGFNFLRNPHFADTHLKGKYRLSFDAKGITSQWTIGLRRGASFIGGTESITWIYADGHYSFTIDTSVDKEECYISFCRTSGTGDMDVTFSNIQLELGETETEYEPYTSSLTYLPISTYFPNGMKSAGNVYDELLPTKAITRVGMVDLGTLTWVRTSTQASGVYRFIGSGLPSDVKRPSANNVVANMSSIYQSVTMESVYYGTAPNMSISLSAEGTIQLRNDSYTTAEAFATAMSGVYLYYELATETETPITTEDSNEALSLLMGKSVSSNNAKQMIGIITKGE